MGEMRSTTKSNLVECLTADQPTELTPQFGVVTLDGAAIINMVILYGGQTMEQYVKDVFIPYFTSFEAWSIDVVWNVYVDASLKDHTRGK